MSTSDKNDVDAQEIPLEQLGEVAGGSPKGSHSGANRPKDPTTPPKDMSKKDHSNTGSSSLHR